MRSRTWSSVSRGGETHKSRTGLEGASSLKIELQEPAAPAGQTLTFHSLGAEPELVLTLADRSLRRPGLGPGAGGGADRAGQDQLPGAEEGLLHLRRGPDRHAAAAGLRRPGDRPRLEHGLLRRQPAGALLPPGRPGEMARPRHVRRLLLPCDGLRRRPGGAAHCPGCRPCVGPEGSPGRTALPARADCRGGEDRDGLELADDVGIRRHAAWRRRRLPEGFPPDRHPLGQEGDGRRGHRRRRDGDEEPQQDPPAVGPAADAPRAGPGLRDPGRRASDYQQGRGREHAGEADLPGG